MHRLGMRRDCSRDMMRMEQMDPETLITGPPAPTSPSNPVLSSLELSLVGSGAPRAPPVPGGLPNRAEAQVTETCPTRFPGHHPGNWPIYNRRSKPIKREHWCCSRRLPCTAAPEPALARENQLRAPVQPRHPPLPASLKKAPLNGLNRSFSSAQCRDKN